MPIPDNLVAQPGLPAISPELERFLDGLQNPALSEADLIALMPADPDNFCQHDPRTGLTALHVAVYEGRKGLLREMLGRLRVEIQGDMQYIEHVFITARSKQVGTDRLLDHAAFDLYVSEGADLAEVFIGTLPRNTVKSMLHTALISYLNHVINFCFFCRESSSRTRCNPSFEERLGYLQNHGDLLVILMGIVSAEEDSPLPSLDCFLIPITDRGRTPLSGGGYRYYFTGSGYSYEDYPDAVPSDFIRAGEATKAKVIELKARYGRRALTRQDILDLASVFLRYSEADYERHLRRVPQYHESLYQYPENLPYFDRALTIHQSLAFKTQLLQALKTNDPDAAVRACVQTWRGADDAQRLNPAHTLALEQMMQLAEKEGNFRAAYILSRALNAELQAALTERAVAARQATVLAPEIGVRFGGAGAASSNNASAQAAAP